MKGVRILFAGTPELAVPALQALASRAQVCGVLTNPDAPSGRGARLAPSPVKQAALALGLSVLQPEGLNEAARAAVKELHPELLVVVACGHIFGPRFLGLFPRGAVNMHPSLLPRHRGSTPIPATILAGDPVAGVTIQRVAAEVDSGAILAQAELPLDGTETTTSLTARIAPVGAELLVDVVGRIEEGTLTEREQDHGRASYCRKLAKADGLLDWDEDAALISRKVRAYDAFPGTYTTLGGKILHILEARPLEERPSMAPGFARPPWAAGLTTGVVLGVDKRYGIMVSTGRGVLCILRLKLEARKALDWRSFCNGVPGLVGARLGESNHAATVDTTASHE